mmetsp:Transcript_10187/g.30657  ORF Transcript_10187/g.30657 Transcript_10187/m.30657 type:complete len:205 (-) Transcript_10187:2740-3354(-)
MKLAFHDFMCPQYIPVSKILHRFLSVSCFESDVLSSHSTSSHKTCSLVQHCIDQPLCGHCGRLSHVALAAETVNLSTHNVNTTHYFSIVAVQKKFHCLLPPLFELRCCCSSCLKCYNCGARCVGGMWAAALCTEGSCTDGSREADPKSSPPRTEASRAGRVPPSSDALGYEDDASIAPGPKGEPFGCDGGACTIPEGFSGICAG